MRVMVRVLGSSSTKELPAGKKKPLPINKIKEIICPRLQKLDDVYSLQRHKYHYNIIKEGKCAGTLEYDNSQYDGVFYTLHTIGCDRFFGKILVDHTKPKELGLALDDLFEKAAQVRTLISYPINPVW